MAFGTHQMACMVPLHENVHLCGVDTKIVTHSGVDRSCLCLRRGVDTLRRTSDPSSVDQASIPCSDPDAVQTITVIVTISLFGAQRTPSAMTVQRDNGYCYDDNDSNGNGDNYDNSNSDKGDECDDNDN